MMQSLLCCSRGIVSRVDSDVEEESERVRGFFRFAFEATKLSAGHSSKREEIPSASLSGITNHPVFEPLAIQVPSASRVARNNGAMDPLACNILLVPLAERVTTNLHKPLAALHSLVHK